MVDLAAIRKAAEGFIAGGERQDHVGADLNFLRLRGLIDVHTVLLMVAVCEAAQEWATVTHDKNEWSIRLYEAVRALGEA